MSYCYNLVFSTPGKTTVQNRLNLFLKMVALQAVVVWHGEVVVIGGQNLSGLYQLSWLRFLYRLPIIDRDAPPVSKIWQVCGWMKGAKKVTKGYTSVGKTWQNFVLDKMKRGASGEQCGRSETLRPKRCIINSNIGACTCIIHLPPD